MTESRSAPMPGEQMPDGTTYAGISPDTGRPIYTTAADEPLTYSFREAQSRAATLDAYGYQDWRVPTKNELNVLFNNRAAIGGFANGNLEADGWYWSSTTYTGFGAVAWAQRFGDGRQHFTIRNNACLLRCVRG